jgi:hypothetical protein
MTAPGLVAGEEMRSRAPSGFVPEIDVRECRPVAVADGVAKASLPSTKRAYSITSLAVASSIVGTVRPSAEAVLRLSRRLPLIRNRAFSFCCSQGSG